MVGCKAVTCGYGWAVCIAWMGANCLPEERHILNTYGYTCHLPAHHIDTVYEVNIYLHDSQNSTKAGVEISELEFWSKYDEKIEIERLFQSPIRIVGTRSFFNLRDGDLSTSWADTSVSLGETIRLGAIFLNEEPTSMRLATGSLGMEYDPLEWSVEVCKIVTGRTQSCNHLIYYEPREDFPRESFLPSYSLIGYKIGVEVSGLQGEAIIESVQLGKATDVITINADGRYEFTFEKQIDDEFSIVIINSYDETCTFESSSSGLVQSETILNLNCELSDKVPTAIMDINHLTCTSFEIEYLISNPRPTTEIYYAACVHGTVVTANDIVDQSKCLCSGSKSDLRELYSTIDVFCPELACGWEYRIYIVLKSFTESLIATSYEISTPEPTGIASVGEIVCDGVETTVTMWNPSQYGLLYWSIGDACNGTLPQQSGANLVLLPCYNWLHSETYALNIYLDTDSNGANVKNFAVIYGRTFTLPMTHGSAYILTVGVDGASASFSISQPAQRPDIFYQIHWAFCPGGQDIDDYIEFSESCLCHGNFTAACGIEMFLPCEWGFLESYTFVAFLVGAVYSIPLTVDDPLFYTPAAPTTSRPSVSPSFRPSAPPSYQPFTSTTTTSIPMSNAVAQISSISCRGITINYQLPNPSFMGKVYWTICNDNEHRYVQPEDVIFGASSATNIVYTQCGCSGSTSQLSGYWDFQTGMQVHSVPITTCTFRCYGYYILYMAKDSDGNGNNAEAITVVNYRFRSF